VPNTPLGASQQSAPAETAQHQKIAKKWGKTPDGEVGPNTAGDQKPGVLDPHKGGKSPPGETTHGCDRPKK